MTDATRSLVVVCGGTRWDGMVSTEKAMAARLARVADVLYVDPPLSLAQWWRDRSSRSSGSRPGRSIEPAGPGLWTFTPLVQPGVDRRATARLTEILVRRQIAGASRRLGRPVQAVVVANQRDLLGACGEAVSVVYATDDFVAGADLFGVDPTVLRRQEQRQAAHADLVVCVSDAIAVRWRALGAATVVLPNGCDIDAFADLESVTPAGDVHLPPPIAGFTGHLSERIDVALLEAVADRGASLLLVGPRSGASARLDALVERPNVQWTGPRPAAELPSYLRLVDVGLTPYADTPFNRASDPLKTLEYLAAGRPVVSSELPASRALDTEHVVVAGGSEAFADAVMVALGEPRTPESVAARRALAARHSWDERCRTLLPHLGLS